MMHSSFPVGVVALTLSVTLGGYMNPDPVDAQSTDFVPALSEVESNIESNAENSAAPSDDGANRRSQSFRVLGSLLNAALNRSHSITIDIDRLDNGFAGSVQVSDPAAATCTLAAVNAERLASGRLQFRLNAGEPIGETATHRTANCNTHPDVGLSLDAIPTEETTTITGTYSIGEEQTGRFNATVER